jgi:N-acetylglucosaminyldiphosphoundecaprenol N-acetyl-beta-D-mannosaminyltransferase
MKRLKILNTQITEIRLDELTSNLLSKSKLDVAVCNVNTLVRAKKNQNLQLILNKFDICTPDGFPVALATRLMYKNKQKRVDGYKIFNNTLKASDNKNITHFLYGNTAEVCELIIDKYKEYSKNIKIIGYYSPPFDDYKNLVNDKHIKNIIELKPDIIWVSLGFPKQELFINSLREKYEFNSNLVGVGFTFDWTAGTKIKAPEWVANLGLEWILRLMQEPRRLFKRYLIDNTLFIYYFLIQFLKSILKD